MALVIEVGPIRCGLRRRSARAALGRRDGYCEFTRRSPRGWKITIRFVPASCERLPVSSMRARKRRPPSRKKGRPKFAEAIRPHIEKLAGGSLGEASTADELMRQVDVAYKLAQGRQATKALTERQQNDALQQAFQARDTDPSLAGHAASELAASALGKLTEYLRDWAGDDPDAAANWIDAYEVERESLAALAQAVTLAKAREIETEAEAQIDHASQETWDELRSEPNFETTLPYMQHLILDNPEAIIGESPEDQRDKIERVYRGGVEFARAEREREFRQGILEAGRTFEDELEGREMVAMPTIKPRNLLPDADLDERDEQIREALVEPGADFRAEFDRMFQESPEIQKAHRQHLEERES